MMNRMGGVWLAVALLTSSCGGGLAGTGDYCIEVDPPTHDFSCEAGTVTVSVSNFCGAPITLGPPTIGAACVGVEITGPGQESLEDGETTTFDISYTPEGDEAWDCTVAFSHDLAGEPEPEIPLAGGRELYLKCRLLASGCTYAALAESGASVDKCWSRVRVHRADD